MLVTRCLRFQLTECLSWVHSEKIQGVKKLIIFQNNIPNISQNVRPRNSDLSLDLFLSFCLSISPCLSYTRTHTHNILRILDQQLQGSYSDSSNNVPFLNSPTSLEDYMLWQTTWVLSVQCPATLCIRNKTMSHYFFSFLS